MIGCGSPIDSYPTADGPRESSAATSRSDDVFPFADTRRRTTSATRAFVSLSRSLSTSLVPLPWPATCSATASANAFGNPSASKPGSTSLVRDEYSCTLPSALVVRASDAVPEIKATYRLSGIAPQWLARLQRSATDAAVESSTHGIESN